MTPQEKAKELIDKFTFEIGKFNAKQSALVTVNEIMKALEVGYNQYFNRQYDSTEQYYNENYNN
jgi:hypothetical protein